MPIRNSFLGISAMLLFHALAAASPSPGLAIEADVPLVESHGMPCVEVSLGEGQAGLFAIDSGNVNSLLDLVRARSRSLDLKPIGPSYPDFFTTKVPLVQIGGLTLGALPVLAFDFAANKMPPGIIGTFSYTAFKDRVLQIDFKARRVRISGKHNGREPSAASAEPISYLTFGRQGPPIVVVHGFEINGKPVSVQVDTMYSGTMLIYSASIAKVELTRAVQGDKTEFFPFTDGGVSMKVAPVKTESFHGLAIGPSQPKVFFPTPGVHEPDGLFDGTVGLGLIHDCILTFNLHDDTFGLSN